MQWKDTDFPNQKPTAFYINKYECVCVCVCVFTSYSMWIMDTHNSDKNDSCIQNIKVKEYRTRKTLLHNKPIHPYGNVNNDIIRESGKSMMTTQRTDV